MNGGKRQQRSAGGAERRHHRGAEQSKTRNRKQVRRDRDDGQGSRNRQRPRRLARADQDRAANRNDDVGQAGEDEALKGLRAEQVLVAEEQGHDLARRGRENGGQRDQEQHTPQRIAGDPPGIRVISVAHGLRHGREQHGREREREEAGGQREILRGSIHAHFRRRTPEEPQEQDVDTVEDAQAQTGQQQRHGIVEELAHGHVRAAEDGWLHEAPRHHDLDERGADNRQDGAVAGKTSFNADHDQAQPNRPAHHRKQGTGAEVTERHQNLLVRLGEGEQRKIEREQPQHPQEPGLVEPGGDERRREPQPDSRDESHRQLRANHERGDRPPVARGADHTHRRSRQRRGESPFQPRDQRDGQRIAAVSDGPRRRVR